MQNSRAQGSMLRGLTANSNMMVSHVAGHGSLLHVNEEESKLANMSKMGVNGDNLQNFGMIPEFEKS